MAEGLQRAFAAARATRLSEEDFTTLHHMNKRFRPAGTEKSRQKVRQLGLATYSRSTGWWELTETGRTVLQGGDNGTE